MNFAMLFALFFLNGFFYQSNSKFEKFLTIPCGDQKEECGFFDKSIEMLPIYPDRIDANDNFLIINDKLKKRIIKINLKSKKFTFLKLPVTPLFIAISNSGKVAAYFNHRIYMFDGSRKFKVKKIPVKYNVSDIIFNDSEELFFISLQNRSFKVYGKTERKAGIFLKNNPYFVAIKKRGKNSFEVMFFKKNTVVSTKRLRPDFSIKIKKQGLKSLNLAGDDTRGNIYLLGEFVKFVPEKKGRGKKEGVVKLVVSQKLFVFDKNGKEKFGVKIPYSENYPLSKGVCVTPKGEVFFLVVEKGRIEILRLKK